MAETVASRPDRFLLLVLGFAAGAMTVFAGTGPNWLAQDKHTVFLAGFDGAAEADFTRAASKAADGAWRQVPGMYGKALALQGDETLSFGLAATNRFIQGTIEVITRDLAEPGKYHYNNVPNRRYHRRPLFAAASGGLEFLVMNDQGGGYFLRLTHPRGVAVPGYPLLQAGVTASADKIPNEWVCLAVGWDARRGLMAVALRDATSGDPLTFHPENRRALRFPKETMGAAAEGVDLDSFKIGPAPDLLVDAIRVSGVFREELFELPRGKAFDELPEAPPTAPEQLKK